jgi:manganese/zinc/iron transport system substrate-binding protein
MEQHHREAKDWMESNGKVKALCTTAFVATLVQEIGGDKVAVLTLVNGQNDPHSYQLVKGDDEKFRRADVVFSSGLGLEQGASLSRYLSLYNACAVGDYVARETRGALFIGPTVDPHIWMDLSLWVQGTQIVAKRLSEIRPDLSGYFRERIPETIKKLMKIHLSVRRLLHTIPEEKRYLVTTHDAFQYFSRAYLASRQERRTKGWKKRCIAPEGFSPESQISTQDLNEVVAYILLHHVKEIFSESGMNQDSLQKVIEVCKEKGQEVSISQDSLYSDTMGPEGTYEAMMEHNAHVIYDAMMKASS